MKKSVLSLILALIFITAGSGYYYYSLPDKTILGRALVLMFVANNIDTDVLALEWGKLDLAVEFIDTCTRGDEAKRSACINKHIKNTLERTEAVDKPLLLLADKDSSLDLLSGVTRLNAEEIAALILLQPGSNSHLQNDVSVSKTLIVSDLKDTSENISASRVLASQIRENHPWVWSTLLVDEGDGLLFHPVLPHMVSYLINGKINANYQIEFNAESRWQNPIVNNDKYFALNDLIEKRQIDDDIYRILKAFYAYDPDLLKQWPLEEYKAFNLIKYRNYLPEEQRGRYAIFSNRKGHKFYLDLHTYGEYQPEIVVAIDDENNLYRMTSFYKTRQYYSWKQGGPERNMLYSQSLGAFIHFQSPPPVDLELPYLQYTSILFESIEFTDQNPYADLNELSAPAYNVLTANCIPCHSVNGVGGAAHHLDYLTLEPQPGFAQPLLTYSHDVLDNFFFNQTATAQLIGVNPNYVDANIGRELIDWLESQR